MEKIIYLFIYFGEKREIMKSAYNKLKLRIKTSLICTPTISYNLAHKKITMIFV